MEELEKNETSAHAEENTVSLASAQALADALAKIEVYTPTTWVDNSSPDIDAEHLNKPEQAIKRVTDALNSAVDVIKDLQSQITKNSRAISDVNNNLSNLSNFKKVIADDTSATDIEDLLKKKCKLIKDSGLGVGFYAVIGGWSGHNYGLTIGESMSGMIRIAYFDLNDIYQASCNASDLNNFSYKKVPNSTELDKKATITDLALYAKKTDLSASQDNSYIVTKQNTIDKTLFSNAQFKACRPVNGTGAAAYSFENVGVNSGALYLDPSDYKLHFINYDGKKFIINWTAES